MPLGERIGQAYVKVILDGDKQSLIDAVDDQGRLHKIGQGNAKAYDRGWRKQLDKTRPFDEVLKRSRRGDLAFEAIGERAAKRLRDGMRKGLDEIRRDHGRNEAIGEQIAALIAGGFRERIRKELGPGISEEIADAVSSGMLARFEQTGDFDAFVRDHERLNILVRNATLEQADLNRKVATEAARNRRANIADLEKINALLQQGRSHLITSNAELEDQNDLLGIARRRLSERVRAGEFARSSDELKVLVRDLDRFDRRLTQTNIGLNRSQIIVRRFGDRIGIVFGRGSRNDFLNFVGSVARNATNLFTGLSFGLANMTTNFVKAFQTAREAGEGVFKSLFAAFRGGGGLFASLVRAAPALIAILAALTFVIGPLISLVTSLGGALIALAVTVGGALVGGLGLLGAALVPVAFGIGGLVAAILSLDDAAKQALKQSVQPLVTTFKELGKVVATKAFDELDEDVESLTKAMSSPVFKQFAESLGFGIKRFRQEMVAGFLESEEFFRALSKNGTQTLSIGRQIESLATSTKNLFGGIGGFILAAQIPLASFLHDLEQLTQDFNLFANDTSIGGGRDQITTFLTNALKSLRSLGSLVRSATGLLVDMFNAGGADAGISLLDSFRGKIEDLRDFIRANPGVVEEWFGRAVETTKNVGDGLLAVSTALAQLGTEGAQDRLNTILNLLTQIGEWAQKIDTFFTKIGQIGDLIGAVGKINLGDPFGSKDGSKNTLDQFRAVGEAWKNLFADPKPANDVKNLGTTFSGLASSVNTTTITPPVNTTQLREAQVGYGTVLQLGATVNASPIVPQVTLTQVDTFDARLQKIAAEVQAPKVINVQAPQDPVLALIEKINFISLSLQAIKPANIQLKGANTIPTVAKSVGSLSTALGSIKPKTVTVSGPTVKALIGQLAFLNAITFKTKTLTIKSNTKSVLGDLGAIQSFKIDDKEFTVTKIERTRKVGSARGSIRIAGLADKMAAGGYANYRQFYDPFTIIGESGAEAIVPLSRPLGQVDPSVRMLSAIAQGKVEISTSGGAGIDASGWTIVSNTEDPAAVAQEMLNRLTALSY